MIGGGSVVRGEPTERSHLMFLIIRHKLLGKQYHGEGHFFHKIKAKAEKEELRRIDKSLMMSRQSWIHLMWCQRNRAERRQIII